MASVTIDIVDGRTEVHVRQHGARDTPSLVVTPPVDLVEYMAAAVKTAHNSKQTPWSITTIPLTAADSRRVTLYSPDQSFVVPHMALVQLTLEATKALPPQIDLFVCGTKLTPSLWPPPSMSQEDAVTARLPVCTELVPGHVITWDFSHAPLPWTETQCFSAHMEMKWQDECAEADKAVRVGMRALCLDASINADSNRVWNEIHTLQLANKKTPY